MWMQYFRKNLLIFATNTNNHIEAFNRRIKRTIKPSMHLSECIKELISLIFEFDSTQRARILEELTIAPFAEKDEIIQNFQKVIWTAIASRSTISIYIVITF